MTSRLVAALSLGVALSVPAAAAAQVARADSTVIGVVVSHAGTKAPLEGAELRLAGRDSAYRSDYVGEVSFKRPRGSTMQLRISKDGFASVDTTFQIGGVDWMQIMIALAPAARPAVAAQPTPAQPLPGANVSATRPAAHLAAFEERRAKGRGKYITPEQLRASHDRKLLEMLERLPGLSAVAGSTGSARLMTRTGPTSFVEGSSRDYDVVVRGKAAPVQTKTNRASEEGFNKPGYCEVAVFIDGVYVVDPDVGSLRSTQYDAVEWYTAANVPPEYKRPGTQCGVVLLWSR